MEDERIEFVDNNERKKFFRELTMKLGCKSYKQLALKLKINYDTLNQWIRGVRTIPFSLIQSWTNVTEINLNEYTTRKTTIGQKLKEASKLGVNKLRRKYGKDWMKKLGKKGRVGLQILLENNQMVHKKWRDSIQRSLVTKFGRECYRIIGQRGGRRSIEITPPEKLKQQLENAFRKSFKFRIEYQGLKLRSKPELEIVEFLTSKKIPFEYEKKINGFYPDFFLGNNLIIEVVGLEWKSRIEKLRSKFKMLVESNYKIIVYTYPNMVKYFDDLPVRIITNLNELNDVLAVNRA